MSGAATTTTPANPPEFPQVLGHPRPLWMLFMSEFWERFAFYGIRWAMVLYIVAQFHGGDASGEKPASELYGAYLALVYAGAIFGGYVADKLIGFQRSILLGAVIMATGLFLIGLAQRSDVQARPGHDHRRQRPVQADHLDDGRQAVRAGRRAPRFGLHHLLHGHQHRRVAGAADHPIPGEEDLRIEDMPAYKSCSSRPASAC
jgi:dipeptide/tripeptide permease